MKQAFTYIIALLSCTLSLSAQTVIEHALLSNTEMAHTTTPHHTPLSYNDHLQAGPTFKLSLLMLQPKKITPERHWIILLDGYRAFESVGALKSFLAKQEKGTKLEWSPGCSAIGGEPLRNAEELNSFAAFCKAKGITFIIHPSG